MTRREGRESRGSGVENPSSPSSPSPTSSAVVLTALPFSDSIKYGLHSFTLGYVPNTPWASSLPPTGDDTLCQPGQRQRTHLSRLSSSSQKHPTMGYVLGASKTY